MKGARFKYIAPFNVQLRLFIIQLLIFLFLDNHSIYYQNFLHNVEYTYLVHLECDENNVSHIVDKDKWESLQVGQEISVEKNKYGLIYVDWDNINNTYE